MKRGPFGCFERPVFVPARLKTARIRLTLLQRRADKPGTQQLGTTIGPHVTIKGDIRSEEDLLIDGQVEGTLDLGQHFHAPPAPLAAQRIGGIGDILQFGQYEARNQKRPGKKTCPGYIRDPSVNNDTRIQENGAALRPILACLGFRLHRRTALQQLRLVDRRMLPIRPQLGRAPEFAQRERRFGGL